jgi:hypothetical protein
VVQVIYEIPITPTDPSFIQEVTLDGTTYRLTFRWNDRESKWYLTLTDLDDVVIVASMALVSGASLLRHVVDYTIRPPGELILVGVADRDNLGTDAVLIYADAEEVEAT